MFSAFIIVISRYALLLGYYGQTAAAGYRACKYMYATRWC